MSLDPAQLVLTLLNARTAGHIAHLQTKSYAAHMALGDFYSGIGDIADRFAECWMGCYGKGLVFAGGGPLVLDPIKLIEGLTTELRDAHDACDESHLQQILDDGLELCCSTLYKLTRLA